LGKKLKKSRGEKEGNIEEKGDSRKIRGLLKLNG
jgi:hypothetical protein